VVVVVVAEEQRGCMLRDCIMRRLTWCVVSDKHILDHHQRCTIRTSTTHGSCYAFVHDCSGLEHEAADVAARQCTDDVTLRREGRNEVAK
jgi:hypothetical protein